MIATYHEWEVGRERTDMCDESPWGHFMSGSIQMRYEDGSEETIPAGSAFYMPPGHTAKTDERVTFITTPVVVHVFGRASCAEDTKGNGEQDVLVSLVPKRVLGLCPGQLSCTICYCGDWRSRTFL
jgi:hypothetical protein